MLAKIMLRNGSLFCVIINIVYHLKETCKFFPDLVLLVSSEIYAEFVCVCV